MTGPSCDTVPVPEKCAILSILSGGMEPQALEALDRVSRCEAAEIWLRCIVDCRRWQSETAQVHDVHELEYWQSPPPHTHTRTLC